MNITVIGYRGTGKSTVAPLVAHQLGWEWVDSDTHIEKLADSTIREIFVSEGEAGFREREVAAIGELTARDRLVIAAGGGAVLRPENRKAIRRRGFVVWLTASPETIARRIESDPTTATRRPALTDREHLDEIRQLLQQRDPLYRRCANLIIDTERQLPEQIATGIVLAASSRWHIKTE